MCYFCHHCHCCSRAAWHIAHNMLQSRVLLFTYPTMIIRYYYESLGSACMRLAFHFATAYHPPYRPRKCCHIDCQGKHRWRRREDEIKSTTLFFCLTESNHWHLLRLKLLWFHSLPFSPCLFRSMSSICWRWYTLLIFNNTSTHIVN